ncbi:hypothetical protein CEXT_709121 [Caerostris extrusa]|uniref:Uncharacterized protein n=1 Tax=Caerostris extrusa TaxID=172846 RepID=A0AAV4W050_CAEEX|nr:hypothetical protein CEXT_709121 [Caerostris extrusa]
MQSNGMAFLGHKSAGDDYKSLSPCHHLQSSLRKFTFQHSSDANRQRYKKEKGMVYLTSEILVSVWYRIHMVSENPSSCVIPVDGWCVFSVSSGVVCRITVPLKEEHIFGVPVPLDNDFNT